MYVLSWLSGCAGIQFTILHDYCGDRSTLLSSAFTLVATTTGDCTSTGNSLSTTLGASANFPILADDSATVVFGANQYAIISVSTRAAIIQRWRSVQQTTSSVLEIVDLGSYPKGFACGGTEVGTYTNTLDASCSGRLCGVSDTCQMRAELWQGASINGFGGDQCANDLTFVPDDAQCSDGRLWRHAVADCLAQKVPGGCMYCKGIAMGQMSGYCLNQEGANCQRIFESSTAQAFCNIAFECPASVTSVSFILIVSSLLVLLFL